MFTLSHSGALVKVFPVEHVKLFGKTGRNIRRNKEWHTDYTDATD